MRRMTRACAALTAALIALVSWTPQAHAVGNADAARKAVAYVAAQAGTTTDVGVALNSLLALAAAPDARNVPQATQLIEVVKSGASAYASARPENAAWLALTASVIGLDPRNVNGVNAIDAVKGGVKVDGSFGAVPSGAASGLAIIALTRAGEFVPPVMLRYLVRSANPDGGFPKVPGQASDAEATALAMLGLLTQTDSISARDARIAATAWAQAQQRADGSWAGSTAPGTTALLATALQAAGVLQPRAVQYLVGQQLADGSLPDQGAPSLSATQQAALLLADSSYLQVSAPVLSGAPGATMTIVSPPTASGGASAVTTQPSASTPAPVDPAGPDDGTNALWIMLPILLLALVGGGGYYLFGPPSKPKPTGPVGAAPEAATPHGHAPDAAGPTRDAGDRPDAAGSA